MRDIEELSVLPSSTLDDLEQAVRLIASGEILLFTELTGYNGIADALFQLW